LAQHPGNTNLIFVGGVDIIGSHPPYEYRMSVSRSVSFGSTWESQTNLTTTGCAYESYSGCRDIEVATADNNIVYAVGCEDLKVRVFRSSNMGDTWSDVTGNLTTLYTGSWYGHCIKVHPTDANRVYIGTSRGIYTSSTGGTTWSKMSMSSPIRDLVYDERGRTIYAACETAGVYRLDLEAGGNNWQSANEGLENLRCRCMGIDPVNGYLYIGTYRGGVWRTALPWQMPPDSTNWDELMRLAGFWQETQFNGSSNFVDDGIIDNKDLMELIKRWRK
jgi:hypothetical protein